MLPGVFARGAFDGDPGLAFPRHRLAPTLERWAPAALTRISFPDGSGWGDQLPPPALGSSFFSSGFLLPPIIIAATTMIRTITMMMMMT